jgi:hypothetical protein
MILTGRRCAATDIIGAGLLSAGGAVVVPVNLTPADIAAYLRGHLPAEPPGAWTALLSTLDAEPNGPLASALAFPPALWLVRRVYVDGGSDPATLLGLPSAGRVTDHLFDHLVPELVAAQPPRRARYLQPLRPRRAWPPDRAARWLGHLASQMGDRPELAWWRLPGPSSGRQRRALWTTPPRQPARVDLRLRGRFGALVRNLRWGLTFALLVALIEVFSELLKAMIGAASTGGARTALMLAGIFAVMFGAAGVFVGLMRWSTVPAAVDSPDPPLVSLRRDRPVALVSCALGGLGAGLVGGVAIGVAEWLRAGPEEGLIPLIVLPVFGVAAGLVFGALLFMLGGTASGAYLHTVRSLALRRRVPWRLGRFLDDMHRVGVLDHTGPVYRFRYPRLRQNLVRALRR